MKRLILILFVLLSFGLSAQNQCVTDKKKIDEIKDNITKSCNNINNIRCNYIQEKSVSLLEDDIRNEGEMIFVTPNNLYWKNNTPKNQSFILKEENVKIINDNGETVMPIQEHLIFREISKIINNSISNNTIIDENNFIPSYEENENHIIVNMKPKKNKMKSVLGSMTIHFEKTSYLINKIEITDNNNDVTTITLSDICINKGFDSTLFNF